LLEFFRKLPCCIIAIFKHCFSPQVFKSKLIIFG
jgi:hypothetical protein